MTVKSLADVSRWRPRGSRLGAFISSIIRALNDMNYEALRRKLQLLEHLVQVSEDGKLIFVSEEAPRQPNGEIESLQSDCRPLPLANSWQWVQKAGTLDS